MRFCIKCLNRHPGDDSFCQCVATPLRTFPAPSQWQILRLHRCYLLRLSIGWQCLDSFLVLL